MPDTPPPRFGRRGPRDRSLRAGDADRDAVADALREHHVAGRLDTDELDDRLDRCMSARTFADLDALLADLPGDRPSHRRAGRHWRGRPWPVLLLPIVVVLAIVVSRGHLFWLAFPLLFFFVVKPLIWRRLWCPPRSM
jgi:hypothetical protein